MKHYGDITKISGYDVEPVWIVTGGSPCQDLSVAGKRAGLDGERSGLFMEQIRIIKEMRERDRNAGRTDEFIRPRYMVWENVPGPLAATKERTSVSSSKKRQKSQTKTPLFLDLTKNGLHQEPLWEMGGALLGEYTTHSFGESPSVVVESLLSQILEETPHPKYSLSVRACQGILNRAEKRGKELPPLLRAALEIQSQSTL